VLENYRQQAAERDCQGIPALPLTRSKPPIWSNC
jgi:aconitase B